MTLMQPPYVPPPALRRVKLASWSLFCPAGIGAAGLGDSGTGSVPGFKPRDWVADRKSLKLMGRAVQLGVAGVKAALDGAAGWDQAPASRRGIFVGATPQLGDPDDLSSALDVAMTSGEFDLQAFAEKGIGLIHPLWLVRGLSNNVIGFASAFHDLQGVNSNYCDGRRGGWNALVEGWAAVAEGRADVVVAGGADSYIGAEAILGGPCGEAAAFAVFAPAAEDEPSITLGDAPDVRALEATFGFMGAAASPVAWIRSAVRLP